ncbi:MAG: response regulator transcription factor, partial [Actinomycetota bacterium]
SQRSHEASDLWTRLEGLSRRQVEIITLLSMNLTAKEVAKKLSISPQTVKVHLRNILEKTGAHSYVDVVNMARACGLIRT